jgi:hypothetical protein
MSVGLRSDESNRLPEQVKKVEHCRVRCADLSTSQKDGNSSTLPNRCVRTSMCGRPQPPGALPERIVFSIFTRLQV